MENKEIDFENLPIIEEPKNLNEFNRELLFSRLVELGSWLYRQKGANLMSIIDDIFIEQNWKTSLSSEEINKFHIGLAALRKTNMDESHIRASLSRKLPYGRIDRQKIVKDQFGKWDYVNKLNTNKSDLSDMICELIWRGIQSNHDKGMKIYHRMVEDPKKCLIFLKPNLKKLLIRYFIKNGSGLEDFRKFTKYSRVFSDVGEKSEEKIHNDLISNGFEIIYSGGNGDFIDMIFGTDLIVYREENKLSESNPFISIQVKTRIDWTKLGQYKVDWIAESRTRTYWDLKKQTRIDIEKGNI